jgi:glycolate oxidase FAD binding subunit
MGEMDRDRSEHIAEQVSLAHAEGRPLAISGAGSKAFYGNVVEGEPLDVRAHSGIVDYQPTELVLTARCGTPLAEIEETLASAGQMLAFEPPLLGRDDDVGGTLGGAIATGLSGPRRPFAGSARDFVLGTRIVNGKGEVLRFGGQVMKNVAGFDVSRLMTGAQGTLGVLLDVSVKVLPRPERELTLAHACSEGEAQSRLHEWIGDGIPLSASSYQEGCLHVRLSSTANSVAAAQARIGGDIAGNDFWETLRNQQDSLFSVGNLWRLSLPPATGLLEHDIRLTEWAGAQRWAVSERPLYDLAASLGGHATRCDREQQIEDRFQPLPAALHALHRRLKHAFDPGGILNPGRLYRSLP